MRSSLKFCLQLISTLTMLLLVISSMAGDRLVKITSDNELEYFMQTYYSHPQPELIPLAIEYIGSSKLLSKQQDLALPTAAFFSKIFSDSPASMADWKKSINEQDIETKTSLLKAIDSSPDQLASQAADGMARNDIYWSAFFASGDIAYINKIVDQLKYLEERRDLNLFLAAASAKWSLSSNAQGHLAVRAILEIYKRGDDKKLRLVAEEILTKSPAQIQGETKEIISKQRDNGGWQQ